MKLVSSFFIFAFSDNKLSSSLLRPLRPLFQRFNATSVHPIQQMISTLAELSMKVTTRKDASPRSAVIEWM